MNIRVLNHSAWLTIIAALATLVLAGCAGSRPEALDIPVSIEGGTMSPETIKVKQGDTVTLKIQAKEDGEFHLHGYDIKKDVEAGHVADLYFVANATGRFRITFHHLKEEAGDHREKEGEHKENEGEEIGLGFLEVGPR